MTHWHAPGTNPQPTMSQLREIAHLWTLALECRRIDARLYEHTLGCELRILDDGMLLRTQVHKVTQDAYRDARETCARLAERGAVPAFPSPES
jgi:hypothetical protein